VKPPFRQQPDNWSAREADRAANTFGARINERRDRPDRRRRLWWSVVYGSFNPRRRRPSRRTDESRYHGLDWHSANLWAVSVAILILCVADAFLTVTLMSGGAVEVNPVMALFVGNNVAVFAGLKMAVTGIGILLLVFLARYRFMRLVRVDVILYCVLIAYVALLFHEIGMLRQLGDPRYF
jgi:Domain of unknown function (DUF5658)